MKITEETKIKDLIPEGWELCDENPYSLEDSKHLQLIMQLSKKQHKTLEDYEYKLILSDTTNVVYHGSKVSYYQILKNNHPKQYYSIILQMIADDICEEEQDRIWWLDNYELTCRKANYGNCPLGAVFFDTEEHAKQAREIMGDKLKLLI